MAQVGAGGSQDGRSGSLETSENQEMELVDLKTAGVRADCSQGCR